VAGLEQRDFRGTREDELLVNLTISSNENQLLRLAERDISLRKVSTTTGGEYCGPCPDCGGEDRFRVWPETGRYWCRGCGRKGDSIQFLRDFHGLSFRDACRVVGREILPRSSPAYRKKRRHQHALAAAKEAFEQWSRDKLIELTDHHRELLAEQETAQIALRLIHNRPGFLTEEEVDYWKKRVADIYDELAPLAPLAWQLDIFTYDRYEAERLRMWKREAVRNG